MSSEADKHIDELLERYLGLVDQYTTLRAHLARVQQHMFHALARANFTAERGVRFGQDQYDERMQASRRLTISSRTVAGDDELPAFSIAEEGRTSSDEEEGTDGKGDGDSNGEEEEEKKKQGKNRNPIRWFGVLVPPALREAQSHAVEAVEELVPNLLSVQADMAHLEIEIRRARKKRAKANGAGKKTETTNTAQTVSASS